MIKEDFRLLRGRCNRLQMREREREKKRIQILFIYQVLRIAFFLCLSLNVSHHRNRRQLCQAPDTIDPRLTRCKC